MIDSLYIHLHWLLDSILVIGVSLLAAVMLLILVRVRTEFDALG